MRATWKRKLAVAVGTILVAVTFTFVLIRQMPGDVLHTWALQIMAQQGITYEQARIVAATMMNYDPTESMLSQYAHYLGNLLLHGNLGYSLTYRIPVATILASALPWTVFITFFSAGVSFVVGGMLGLAGAVGRKGWLDSMLTLYATVTQAIPDFLLGILLLLVLGVNLQWFPLRGAYGPQVNPGFNLAFVQNLFYYATLPALSYCLPAIGGWALAMKASATQVLGEDYLQVARAKGLSAHRVLVDYLGRNALPPLLTDLVNSLGGMVGGSMLVESLFGYPGVGYFLGQAISTRDYTLMQGLFLVTTVVVVLGNLLAEFLLTRLDPRLQRAAH